MSRILADLLLLSQVDARLILQMQRFDLAEVLRSVAEHEQQRFRERRIELDGAGDAQSGWRQTSSGCARSSRT